MTISGGTNVGRYKIRVLMGVGGMSDVYLAQVGLIHSSSIWSGAWGFLDLRTSTTANRSA